MRLLLCLFLGFFSTNSEVRFILIRLSSSALSYFITENRCKYNLPRLLSASCYENAMLIDYMLKKIYRYSRTIGCRMLKDIERQ